MGFSLLSLFRPAQKAPRPRISADHWPEAVYAIGDVHGCLAQLLELEAAIVADSAGRAGESWIVMLGDYIDRGPASAQVLDHLIAPPPPGIRRICLAGNHEEMFLDFLGDPRTGSRWPDFGGLETLASYGLPSATLLGLPARRRRDMLAAYIPETHLDFLAGLPALLTLPGMVFVHAGLRPGVPLERQGEQDLLWIREPFLGADAGLPGFVIHGHTPGPEVVRTPHRLCLDTGAFATGVLSGARLGPSGVQAILTTRG
ncbi:metallophosphoesterase family protein [Devosia sp.]|uniref:metallophosphoesterase family protein n=1 Tax=Devosia sp. TaxID=1871048 RepID=UPI002AFFF1F8|nr:metallophosphoesterase family protein [Devosia sp.]